MQISGKWIKTVVKGQTIKFGIEPFKKAVPSTATKIHFISKKDMPADVAKRLKEMTVDIKTVKPAK